MLAVKLLSTLMHLSRFGGEVDLDLERLAPDMAGLAAQLAAAVPGAWHVEDRARGVGYLRLELEVTGGKSIAVNLGGIEQPPNWQPVAEQVEMQCWRAAGAKLCALATAESLATGGMPAAAAGVGRN